MHKITLTTYANAVDLTAGEVYEMIPAENVGELEKADPNWKEGVKAYVVAHEGESTPAVQLGNGWATQSIIWTKEAVSNFVQKIANGLPFKKGHVYDGADNRGELGKTVGKGTRIVDGRFSAIAVAYFPPATRSAKEWKNVSMEAELDLIPLPESGGVKRFLADMVDKLTTFALGDDKPGFPNARGLVHAFAGVHAFDEKKDEEKNGGKERMATLDELIKGVKELNVYPRQLYTLDQILDDREYSKEIEKRMTEKVKEVETAKDKEIAELRADLAKEKQSIAGRTLSEKLTGTMESMKLTDQAKKYVQRHFDPAKLGEVKHDDETAVKVALEKFLSEAKTVAEEIGLPWSTEAGGAAGGTKAPPTAPPGGAGAPDPTNPKDNPILGVD